MYSDNATGFLLPVVQRTMDKFRIIFQCVKVPKPTTGLEGYAQDKQYIGRTYNGLYEVSSKWGSDIKTSLITKALFDEYFALIQKIEQ